MDKDAVVHIFYLLPISAFPCALRAYCVVKDGIASAIGIICYGENNGFNVQSMDRMYFLSGLP